MSGSSRTANVLLPRALTSLFPSHTRACRNEASLHQLLQFPTPAAGHSEAQPGPPKLQGLWTWGLCLSALTERLKESFPPHLLKHQTLARQQAETAVCKRQDLQLTASHETNLLQNQRADI